MPLILRWSQPEKNENCASRKFGAAQGSKVFFQINRKGRWACGPYRRGNAAFYYSAENKRRIRLIGETQLKYWHTRARWARRDCQSGGHHAAVLPVQRHGNRYMQQLPR